MLFRSPVRFHSCPSQIVCRHHQLEVFHHGDMKFYASTTFIVTNSCGEDQHLRVTATKRLSGSLHPHLWLYIYGYMCVLLCVNYPLLCHGHLLLCQSIHSRFGNLLWCSSFRTIPLFSACELAPRRRQHFLRLFFTVLPGKCLEF